MMGQKRMLLIAGLVMCLFSTAFAQTANEWQQGAVNTADPNLPMVSQGAPTSEVYCDPCLKAAQYKLAQHTRAAQKAAQDSAKPSTGDGFR